MTEQELVNLDDPLFYIGIFILGIIIGIIFVLPIIKTFGVCNQTRHRTSSTERTEHFPRNYMEKRD